MERLEKEKAEGINIESGQNGGLKEQPADFFVPETPVSDEPEEASIEAAEKETAEETEEAAEGRTAEKAEEAVEERAAEETEESAEEHAADETEESVEERAAEETEEPAEERAAEEAAEAGEERAAEVIEGSAEKTAEEYVSEETEEYPDEEDSDEEDGGAPGKGRVFRGAAGRVLGILGRIFLLAFVIFVILVAVFYGFPLRTVTVEGNTFHSSKQIADAVLSDGDPVITHNTVFLTVKNAIAPTNDIPFVESLRFRITGTDSVNITVKEKDPAGYVPYSGRNLYFNADGTVCEISPYTVQGITYVGGLQLKRAEMGVKISSERESDVTLLLEALRTLKKYDLHADSILVTENGAIDLFIGNVQIKLGKSDYDLKISRISLVLPYLPERGGLIDLTSYSEADENIVLQ